MTAAVTGSVFIKLAEKRGRYREVAGEVLGAEDVPMRDLLLTMLERNCVQAEKDVEVRGRLYRAPVHVLADQPTIGYLEADRDGVPVGARATKTGWRDHSALPYLRHLASRWSRTESPTHEPGMRVSSGFIPPRLQVIGDGHDAQEGGESLHWEDLSGHARVVLIGEPGAGKSTCLRRLVYEAKLRSAQQFDTLPIYIQLREFAARDLEVEYLRGLLAAESPIVGLDEFDAPRYGGRIHLLLDGLDEIASERERDRLLEKVQALCVAAPSVRIILTTREYSYKGELPEFTHVRIEPFTLDRIANWCSHASRRLPTDKTVAQMLAAVLPDAGMRDLMSNPLMLAVIIAACTDDRLADERASLLRRCVELLTEDWDAARRVARWSALKVTPRQLETSLADLSCALVLQNRAEFTVADVAQLVASNVGIHESPTELLNACHATGLITTRDRETYRFTHQALGNYLAASRVAYHVSDAKPLLLACQGSPTARSVWRLSCAATTDASDLLDTALKLKGPAQLERAALLAGALGQPITAPRRLIEECSEYIATQLEDELANASIAPPDSDEHNDADTGHDAASEAILWRAQLRMPVNRNSKTNDHLLEQFLVAVHNTRSGSGHEQVKTRLEQSQESAVRLLATLVGVEGDCTARVHRSRQQLSIVFVVVDPAKMLAAELSQPVPGGSEPNEP